MPEGCVVVACSAAMPPLQEAPVPTTGAQEQVRSLSSLQHPAQGWEQGRCLLELSRKMNAIFFSCSLHCKHTYCFCPYLP